MLSIFSTLEELREAPDDEITSSLFSVERTMLVQYFLELRNQTNQTIDSSKSDASRCWSCLIFKKQKKPVLSSIDDICQAPDRTIIC